MHTFACQTYPLDEKLEPRISRTRLIPMFQSDKEVAEIRRGLDRLGPPPGSDSN